MEIVFNTAKDATNKEKHGVSLGTASDFEWDEAVTWPDERRDYGEARMVGIGYIGNRLYVIVFVDRGDERRIISLRKANKREESIYAQT
jgi:uncharacterized DUF497 family protein